MTDQDFTHIGFQKHLSEHKLMGTQCKSCGAKYLPPRPLCVICYGDAMEWIEMPGEGKLAAFTTVHIAPTAMIAAGYGRDNPYCSGIVTLENGLSISAQILGLDVNQPQTIEIGVPLKVEFIERGEGNEKKTFLAFRTVQGL
ncbi:MAG TPA: Zn-ribbon domain-containing OB-fold protein [Anaerolineales bacterium]|nr:Zn-ribbon domain-containing OB-fold protein [Anaerolineales bacterium]